MTASFKEKILIAGCIVVFASIILLEYPNFRISMNIKDAVTTYTAFMPTGLFLLYLLRTIPKRLFLLRKKFFKVYGTVLDSFPAGKSWFPVIQYRTQENQGNCIYPGRGADVSAEKRQSNFHSCSERRPYCCGVFPSRHGILYYTDCQCSLDDRAWDNFLVYGIQQCGNRIFTHHNSLLYSGLRSLLHISEPDPQNNCGTVFSENGSNC